MESPSYLFSITPSVEGDEDAFERSLVQSLQKVFIFRRNVESSSHTLFKGKDEEGRTLYLWRLVIILVGGDSSFQPGLLTSLIPDIQKQVAPGGTVSFIAFVETEVAESR